MSKNKYLWSTFSSSLYDKNPLLLYSTIIFGASKATPQGSSLYRVEVGLNLAIKRSPARRLDHAVISKDIFPGRTPRWRHPYNLFCTWWVASKNHTPEKSPSNYVAEWSRRHAGDRLIASSNPTPRAIKAAPLRCSLGCHSESDGRIHQ